MLGTIPHGPGIGARFAPAIGRRYNRWVDVALAIAVLISAAVAAGIQSLSGFGFSLFIVPVLAVLIGPKETVFLANVLSVVLNAVQLPQMRASVDWQASWRLLVGSFIGMPFGVAVLVVLDPGLLKLVIAGTVIVFTALLVRGLRLQQGGGLGDVGVGFVSGVLNTSTSMSGPPVVISLEGKGLPPMRFRASNTFFFFVGAIGSVVLLAIGGASTVLAWQAAVVALPGVFFGRLVGNTFYRGINDRLFRRIVFGVLLISASVAIGTTLLG